MRIDELQRIIEMYIESDDGLAHIGGTFYFNHKKYRWDIIEVIN